MKKRLISSVVGLPILAFFIIMGGMWLVFAVLVLSILGMREFYRAFYRDENPLWIPAKDKTAAGVPTRLAGYGAAVAYCVLLPFVTSNAMLMFFAAFVVVLLVLLVVFYEEINIMDCGISFFGFFYVAFLLSFLYLVRSYTYGEFFVWMIIIGAWGSDTGAFMVGRLCGKHPLAPRLSPKKTVEGAIGGVLMACLLSMVYAGVSEAILPNEEIPLLFAGICGAVCAVLAQLGDLAASAIKRNVGVKDYGDTIPGHGGILDRFDSVLFTAPGVYLVLLILIGPLI